MMELTFVSAETQDFDPGLYLSMLMAIAKADRGNGPPEYAYVRRQASYLGLDYEHFLDTVNADFLIGRHEVSRLTALVILKDAIILATMDRNFSLPERSKVYTYAEKLDISRSDLDALVDLIKAYRTLNQRWDEMVAGHGY